MTAGSINAGGAVVLAGKQHEDGGNESVRVVERLVCPGGEEFLCDTKWFNRKVSLFSKKMRPGPNVRFSPGKLFTFHTLQNKSDPAPRIHRNFSRPSSLIVSSGLRRGAPAFELNVQMSSVTQNRSKTT